MELGLITETLAKSSIRLGGVYIPIRNLPDSLSKFSQALLADAGRDQTWPAIFRGSSLKVCYKERYYQLATAHQYQSEEHPIQPSSNRLLIDPGSEPSFLPPDAFGVPDIQEESGDSLEDLIIFRYQVSDATIQRRFLSSDEIHWCDSASELPGMPLVYFLIGFPSDKQAMEGDETLNHLRTRYAQILLEFNPEAIEWIDRRIYLRTTSRSDQRSFDPDGLSGSPIYAISKNAEEFYLNLVGLVTDANRSGEFAAYPAGIMRRMLNWCHYNWDA